MTQAYPVVVKLGGSLAGSPAPLALLMEDITAAAAGGAATVIVPGGGVFADSIRQAQLAVGFDDACAHAMALLAMAQYGYLLGSLPRRGVRLAWGVAEVAAALAERPDLPIIWLPDPRSDGLDVEPSWRVTSDSLALWLARRLGALKVILVKNCAAPPADELAELAARGILDAAFPAAAASGSAVTTLLIYAGQRAELQRALAASN